MRARWTAGLSLLALAAACRWSPFSSSLGPGAELPAAEARTEAQALASLALIEGTFQNHTAPVLRVQGGLAYVLVGDKVWGSDVAKLRATFTSEAGTRQTVGDAVVVRQGVQLGKGAASLLAFPVPDFPLQAAAVTRGSIPGVLKAVDLRRSGPPVLAELIRAGEVAADGTFPLKRVDPNTYAGRLLLDPGRGQLAALAPEPEAAIRMDHVLQAFAGRPGRTVLRRVRAGEGCRIEAELTPDDPLGTLLEAGLVLGKPGVEWAIPDVWHADPHAADFARVRGEKPPQVPPSPVVPVGRRLAARAAPGVDGRFQLSAEVNDCEAVQFAQVVLVGMDERWLSWPYRLPAASAPPAPVAADREAWRVEQAPAAASLVFEGEAVQLPPAKPSDAACCPPLAALDPDGVYLVARKERFDDRCRDGLLVYPPGAEDQARCVEREAFEAIGSDGLPLYWVRRSQGSADGPDLRRAVPDASTRDAEGQCQLAATRLNDDLLASKPCGEAAAPAWFGPDGEVVFACSQEYRRRDGTPLELHGASLVRLGEGGTALVRLPWGMLGVLGPDGKGREVGGLPLAAGLNVPPSAAVPDGFLVVVSTAARSPAELGALEVLELFHVSFEGVAEPRGAFPPLGREAANLTRRLGPDGALYTVPSSMGAGTLTRWAVGEAPRVLFESWKQKGDDRVELQPLLFGWRAAAPGRTEGRPVKPYEASPQQRALAAYALTDPAALPCKAPLDRLDPERVWIRLFGWVFDPRDPTRFAWSEESSSQTAELRIGGDGRLLTLRQGVAISTPMERRVEALATAAGELRPGGGGCVKFTGSSPAPLVPGGSCGERVETKGPWAPVPGSSEVALQCAGPWPKRETRVGDVTLPEDRFLVHAGTGGRLLFASRARGPRFAHDPQPTDRWLLVLADGRQVPLDGVPLIVHAIRAAPDGFLLVAPAPPEPQPSRKKAPPPPPPPPRSSAFSKPPPPPQPPLALFLLTDDGRLRTLGTYPGLPGDAGLEDLALAADRSLHAILFRFNVGMREVRLPLGGKELEVEWETKAQISANVMELLTGP